MMNCRQIFSRNLRVLMACEGMKNKDLAKRMGVVLPTVTTWASGKAIPEADNLDKLAKTFHVPISKLFSTEISFKESE